MSNTFTNADHDGAVSVDVNLDTDHDGAVSVDVNLDVNPSEAMKQLQRWLWALGLATLVLDASTAFYKSPHGVVFEQHRSAYYATLGGIFSAGLAEVGTAFWLASSGQQGRARSRAFRVSVVCASVVPLVAIIALGGFSVLMKG